MTWLTYRISTGILWCNDRALCPTGYSGHGEGLNNSAMCSVQDVGPLPAGIYAIEQPVDPPGHLGPLAFPLIPAAANEMYGRNGFYMHGDNAEMNHSASDGCIILPHGVRAAIARMLNLGSVTLKVVA